MSDFDTDAFLNWLDEQDGYYVSQRDVKEKWPEYPWENLVGITKKLEDGESFVPSRDLRQGVVRGEVTD